MTFRQREMIREDPPFPSPSQRTGGCDGNCRNQKARADACQCLSAKTDGLRIAAEQSDQLFRNGKADAGSNKHDHRTHNQGDLINLPHTLMLACAVVEADNRRMPCTMPFAVR